MDLKSNIVHLLEFTNVFVVVCCSSRCKLKKKNAIQELYEVMMMISMKQALNCFTIQKYPHPHQRSIRSPCLSYSSYTGLCWPTHDRWCQHSRETRQSRGIYTSTATVKMCQKSLPNQKAFINGRQGNIKHPKSKTGSWHQEGKQRHLQRLKRGQQHQRHTPYPKHQRLQKQGCPHLYWGLVTR